MNSDEAFTTRTSCRVCGSSKLVDILSLGSHHVSDFVEENPGDALKVPLELILCDQASGGCGLLQLRHTTNPALMYRHYWYRSVVNDTMRQALANICDVAEVLVPLAENDIVVDIGCNDGTLLRSYRGSGIRRVGFEPAHNLIEHAEVGTHRIINDFFNSDAFFAEFGQDTRARIVTSIAMFYDLEDPNAFVSGVKEVLAEDGIWIIQMSYLPLMLERNAFDNICHEHLEYYSLTSLKNLLDRHQFKILDVELNEVNGGSYRVYIQHDSHKGSQTDFQSARVKAMELFEEQLGLNEAGIYHEFASRVHEEKEKLMDFVHQETSAGKSVYVYGASTKGNTLLQFYGLDDKLIKGAAERNPDKWGKRTVGTGIPIVSEADARAVRPDYFLALPWHFLPEFIRREKDFLESGGKFIVPLPYFILSS